MLIFALKATLIFRGLGSISVRVLAQEKASPRQRLDGWRLGHLALCLGRNDIGMGRSDWSLFGQILGPSRGGNQIEFGAAMDAAGSPEKLLMGSRKSANLNRFQPIIGLAP
jgi:hypothetical protein